MTSKKSFLVRFIKSNVPKIWMWVVCFITMLILYPGLMLVYFSRMTALYPDDTLLNKRLLVQNMNDAVCTVIGFRNNAMFVILAFVMAFGIFTYVNSRNKMDLYRSIPISAKHQYFKDYFAGIVIVFVTYVFAVLCTIAIAAGWGYLPTKALVQCLIMLVINLLMFIFYYSIAIICIMLTGNIIVAAGLGLAVSFGLDFILGLMETLKDTFFATVDRVFNSGRLVIAPALSFDEVLWEISDKSDYAQVAQQIMPTVIHLVIGCLLLVPTAYFCFKKRPTEAMHKAIYNKPIAAMVKIIVTIYSSIGVGYVIYTSSSESTTLMLLATAVCAVIVGMAFETLYSFDLRAAVKRWYTTLAGILLSLLVAIVFICDFAGYDQYVPGDDVDSYAISIYTGGYGETFEAHVDEEGKIKDCIWADNADLYLDSMYITDMDSIRKLAKIAQRNDQYKDYEGDKLYISVHYRKDGGIDVDRSMTLNPYDEETVTLLDRIVGSEEWRKGFYQFYRDNELFVNGNMQISYSNGISEVTTRLDMPEFLEAYEKDSAKFDYSRGLNMTPCGKIVIYPSKYWMYNLPIYDDYENCLKLLEEDGSLIEKQLSPEAVASIRVTNYHNEYWEENNNAISEPQEDPSVAVTITEPGEIKDILECAIPNELQEFWGYGKGSQYGYGVDVYLTEDYPIDNYYGYVSFSFRKTIPDWIVERTARGE